jgi:hypothetical protein
MHLLKTYSLASGAMIDKPFIYQKFFPLPFSDFITFHPCSKNSKTYDYWQDVIDEIFPVLNNLNIKIIQIGASGEHSYKNCINIQGGTGLGQVAYLLNKARLHLGADSFPVHMASSMSKKIVALYANNFISNVSPYWSRPEDVALLEPNRGKDNPNFVLDENPKTINKIPTEDIVNSVFKLLEINSKSQNKTIFVGSRYSNTNLIMDFVPNQVVNFAGQKMPTIELRMDLEFNEEILKKQLSTSKCSIITNRPISKDILVYFKKNVVAVFYIVEQSDNPEFIRLLKNLGIKTALISYLSEEELSTKKINYYELGKINRIPATNKEILDLLNKESNLYYKSNKLIHSNKNIFFSVADFKNNLPASINQYVKINKLNEDFASEIEHFKIVKKLD